MNDPSMSCNDFPCLHPNNCMARKLVEVPSIATDLTNIACHKHKSIVRESKLWSTSALINQQDISSDLDDLPALIQELLLPQYLHRHQQYLTITYVTFIFTSRFAVKYIP